MLRMCGVATWMAAWRRAVGVFAFSPIWLNVRPAPKLPFSFFSSATCARETSTCGAWWRRFVLGSRSVPPAISIARGPSPARIFAASATKRGARCSNHGRLSIALGLLAVAVFPRRQHERRLGVWDRREAFRSHSLVRLLQSPQDLVRRDRDLVDAHAERIVNRVRDRGHHRQQRPLPDFFRAVRGVGIAHFTLLFDQRHLDFGHVERGE